MKRAVIAALTPLLLLLVTPASSAAVAPEPAILKARYVASGTMLRITSSAPRVRVIQYRNSGPRVTRVLVVKRTVRVRVEPGVVRVLVRTLGVRPARTWSRKAPNVQGPTSDPTDQVDSVPPVDVTPPSPEVAYKRDMNVLFAAVNTARATGRYCGATWYGPAAPLSYEPNLASAAQAEANDMIARHYFGHTMPDGQSALHYFVSQTAYPGSPNALQESLGLAIVTEQGMVAGWLGDPMHCAGVMNPDQTYAGVAYAVGIDPAWYYPQSNGRPAWQSAGLTEDQIPTSIVWVLMTGRY